MMTEDTLKQFYGPILWAELDETEKMLLRELHRGGNHRVPPDRDEQLRREGVWKSIQEKQARVSRRRGHGYGSSVGRR